MSNAPLRINLPVCARFLVACIALFPAMTAARSAATVQGPSARPPDPKCGLAWHLGDAGLAAKDEIPATMAAPTRHAALQSERVVGAFRFHYDTSGTNAPAMLDGGGARISGSHEEWVDSAGAIFNHVYTTQTGALGYTDPVQPGQGSYDVYIFNSVYYGETVPDARIGVSTPARYTSHINIDNDFQHFYSPGMAGLRVTAAHEFFHAVQFGSYGYWSTDIYFMELSSTWMEDVLYGDVNDYYQYLRGNPVPGGYTPRGHFARPDFSLLRTDGLTEYSRAILGKYIEQRFSADVMRRAWEMVPSEIAVDALDHALGERGSSFREAFLEWSVWNGQTGPEADTVGYYTEGRQYPRIVTDPVIDYVSPGRTIADSIWSASVSYHPVTVNGTPMSVIVANLRTSGTPSIVSFRYEMADAGDQTFKKLSNGIYVRLDVADPTNWSTVETAPAIIEDVTTAPNPFTSGDSRAINFHIPAGARPSSVNLTVLGIGMDRIFQGPLSIRDDLSTPFVQVAEWDVRDGFGRTLPSGVYIYVLTVDGAEHTGKFSVVR